MTGTACWACGAPAGPSVAYASLGLLECPACGLLFDPRSEAEVRALYDDAYFEDPDRAANLVADESARRREARARVRWVRGAVGAGRLLEIGSGGGWFLSELPPELEGHGVEPAPETARDSARRLGVDVEAGFVEDVALAQGAYDVACAWHVVEHLREPATGLGRIRDALRPGGLLFVEVPNVASVASRALGVQWLGLDPAHHVAHYGPRSLRALLETAAFEVVDVHSFPSARLLSARQLLWPGMLLTQARQAAALRRWPLANDPVRQDLLRAVARRPAGL